MINNNSGIYKTGKEYTVPPSNIKMDEGIVEFNQLKSDAEYESVKEQIKKDGQLQPIYIRKGLCVDGRHRTKICNELGIEVRCIDLIDTMSDEQCVRISNTNIFGSRNDGPNQLAIKAYKLVKQFGYKDVKAIELVGISKTTGKQLMPAIRYLVDNGYEWVIDKVLNKESCTIYDEKENVVYRGSSLRKLKQVIYDLEDSDNLEDEDDYIEPVIDYNSIIKSEADRVVFWDRFGKNNMLTIDDKVFICNLFNRKYIGE